VTSFSAALGVNFTSYKAVIVAIAFAVPIPWNLINSSTDSFANSFRLLLAEINIFLAKETALSFLLPDPIKMAISSASESDFFHFNTNFFRGL